MVRYTDGENVGKQDEKEKDKGHEGDETSKSGLLRLFIYLRAGRPSEGE